jgi:trk system potassium uptake protein
MRAVFVGAGSLAVMTARHLLKRGHEVVMIESDKERIEALAEELDCGFLHGDGAASWRCCAKPILQRPISCSASPATIRPTSWRALPAARSLGFGRVVPKIDDPEFEHLCIDHMEIIARVKDEARVFSFIAREEDEKRINELDLPQDSRVMFFYRDEKFTLPQLDSKLKRGDEVMLITHSRNTGKLQQRWGA